MKKILLMCILALFLTGCSKEEPFSYDDTLQTLVKQYGTDNCFITDYSQQMEYTTSQRNFIITVYNTAGFNLKSCSNQDVIIDYVYFNKEDVYNTVITDTEGFIKDVQNMQSLNIAQTEINDYVYDYLYRMINSCNKESREIQLTLEQCNTAPFYFVDNKALLDSITADASTLVYELVTYASTYSAVEVEELEQIEPRELIPGNVYVLSYDYADSKVPIMIKVTEVLEGIETKNKLLTISANNESSLVDNAIYLEYEVTNYSNEEIIFESRFYDADINSCILFYDDINYVGINEKCVLPIGSTIVVRDVVISNGGDLVWRDTYSLYQLNHN